ncbi:hypothetical protein [Olsenella profusa]|uniref:LytR family transcriptional regulator n=1 Tax=Olsenella profusa TaxID=138595 RepID=A0ABS2F242_9ACTN|nr:hypothetical protein [Olsenella profusa]MBM6774618.1 hypothetical protein [Olsenella profusa]
MARKRERFDRTDVPKVGPYTNVIGAIVCVVVLVAVAVVVALVWNRVSLESHLGDRGLSDALEGQASAVVPDGGYTASTDDVACTLLLTADSLDATGATLTSAQILSVNSTQGTATLVTVPVEVSLTAGDATTTLGELFSSQGYAACVAPLASAANVSFSHVIVTTGDVIDSAASLAGTDPGSLVRSASDLLSRMRTDLDAAGLLSLAETLSGIGVSNLATADAPLAAGTATDEAGNVVETGTQVLDSTQLDVALGTLVPAA